MSARYWKFLLIDSAYQKIDLGLKIFYYVTFVTTSFVRLKEENSALPWSKATSTALIGRTISSKS